MKITIKQILIHGSLFVITFITATMAGTEWTYGKSIFMSGYRWEDFLLGLPYSISLLAILTIHEMGHYFMAIYYRVKTTLPYYIPLPPFPFMLGTMGALIRLKSRIVSNTQHFDIGVAGPLAGFVVAIGVLWYGFTSLPPPEYIFDFHPDYKPYGLDYANHVYSNAYMAVGQSSGVDVVFGKNLLYIFFESFVGDPDRIPNTHEIIHYPYLLAGFFALVFTSINLLPIGQLDGGHILYGLLGFDMFKKVASLIFILFLFYAGLGYIQSGEEWSVLIWKIPLFIGFLYVSLMGLKLDKKSTLMYALAIFTVQYGVVFFFPDVEGYSGWLLFALIIGKFIGIEHPRCHTERPLAPGRQIVGWIALFVFIITFSPNPIVIKMTTIQ